MRCAPFLGLYGFLQGVFETLPSFPYNRSLLLFFSPLTPPPSAYLSLIPRCIPLQALRLTLSNHLTPTRVPSIVFPEFRSFLCPGGILQPAPADAKNNSVPPTPPAPLHLIPLTMGRML
eukprot:TRINITY_DN3690_c0_g1_i5.p1 TRINITY_DN3690_c0_g1~~TRINITY_DN3690_c0_g1_i5.p1  ORF type:complete len:119 (-),score=2.79 TRINITY_DN3690_c0_g1_i5:711-1067(-)